MIVYRYICIILYFKRDEEYVQLYPNDFGISCSVNVICIYNMSDNQTYQL